MGQDYERQFLEDIYARIAAERLKLNDEVVGITPPTAPAENQNQMQDLILSKKFHLTEDDLIVIKGTHMHQCNTQRLHLHDSRKAIWTFICFPKVHLFLFQGIWHYRQGTRNIE